MILWRDARMFILFLLIMAGLLGVSAARYYGVEISFQKLAGGLQIIDRQPQVSKPVTARPVAPVANPVLSIERNPVNPFVPQQG